VWRADGGHLGGEWFCLNSASPFSPTGSALWAPRTQRKKGRNWSEFGVKYLQCTMMLTRNFSSALCEYSVLWSRCDWLCLWPLRCYCRLVKRKNRWRPFRPSNAAQDSPRLAVDAVGATVLPPAAIVQHPALRPAVAGPSRGTNPRWVEPYRCRRSTHSH
jgi:hypothetical protein